MRVKFGWLLLVLVLGVGVSGAARADGGNVDVDVRNGDLVIQGDNKDNCIEVKQLNPSKFEIRGCSNGEGHQTKINGRSGSFTASNVRDDTFIKLRGGDDEVRLTANGPAFPGDLDVQTGSGKDVVKFRSVQVQGDTNIDTGTEDDKVLIEDEPADLSADKSFFFGSFEVDAGGGDDFVNIIDGRFEQEVDVALRNGNRDGLCVCASTFRDEDVVFSGGRGNGDRFVIEATDFEGSPLIGDLVEAFEGEVDDCSFLGGRPCAD